MVSQYLIQSSLILKTFGFNLSIIIFSSMVFLSLVIVNMFWDLQVYHADVDFVFPFQLLGWPKSLFFP